MTHDPLCPTVSIKNKTVTYEFGSCSCALIARVREDERMRDDDYAYVATQSYATALRDAVEAVKVLPSAWTDAAYRDKAIAAIEALSHNRTENGTGLAQCFHQNGLDVWEDSIPHCRECGQDMSNQYEMGN